MFIRWVGWNPTTYQWEIMMASAPKWKWHWTHRGVPIVVFRRER